ncbi:MAG: hypothetical protein QM636_11465 [Rhizobium sp.]
MSFIDRLLDSFRGKAITIPPYDGAYKPNTLLEDAPTVLSLGGVDNLAQWGERTVFSAGPTVYALSDGVALPVSTFGTPINALAPLTPETLVLGLESGGIVLHGGNHDGRRLYRFGAASILCSTSIAALDERTLVITQGSARHAPQDRQASLLEKDASGSVWKLDIVTGEALLLAEGLAWPASIMPRPDGSAIVSEAFSHRLLRISLDGNKRQTVTVLKKIPGYPGHLSPARDGGAWLSVFAPRNRLIEFVLQEDVFRAHMLETVAREHWIAPTLISGESFLEPLQCGAVRTMGVHKPWAPSRSYGLAVRLDAGFQPVASFHSRADGTRHGVTSILDTGSATLASLKGPGLIVDLEGKAAR